MVALVSAVVSSVSAAVEPVAAAVYSAEVVLPAVVALVSAAGV